MLIKAHKQRKTRKKRLTLVLILYKSRAENFRMLDIEINARSSLFANIKTNLVFKLISRD